MKFLTFIMLASFSLSSTAGGDDPITKKDCKRLEKVMTQVLKEQGFSKKQIKYAKRIVSTTCGNAVKMGMSGDEYARDLLSILQVD